MSTSPATLITQEFEVKRNCNKKFYDILWKIRMELEDRTDRETKMISNALLKLNQGKNRLSVTIELPLKLFTTELVKLTMAFM